MSINATEATPVGERLPNESEIQAAKDLLSILAPLGGRQDGALILHDDAGRPMRFNLPPALAHTLVELVGHLANGKAVTMIPIDQELSTQQAADILNISRPSFVRMIEEGELPFHRVGRHRRVRADDIFAYKKARDERREQALKDLAALDGELF